MAYKFKSIEEGTYQVEDHTIIKNGNGSWEITPEVTSMRLEKEILNFTKALDND
jgi:hypothetical protein